MVAASLVLAVFTGCGGGGGGGGNESAGANNPATAPDNVAAQTLLLNGSATREIDFASSGNVWTEDRNGTIHGGTYEYHPNGNAAELVLVESGVASTVRLAFASAESGAYTAASDQGTFRLQQAQNSPDQPENPDTPGDEQALAPNSLDGAVMYGTRTYTSTGPVGQTHVYTFTGSSFHDSDPPEESDGSYIYEPAGNHATLTLNYYAPRVFNGDHHALEMSFNTASSGTFESVYTRRDGTTIQINGTFRME